MKHTKHCLSRFAFLRQHVTTFGAKNDCYIDALVSCADAFSAHSNFIKLNKLMKAQEKASKMTPHDVANAYVRATGDVSIANVCFAFSQ
jgi:hypothetical protein